MDALKKAGADPEFFTAVIGMASPYVPPPAPTGSLAVACGPAECEVSLGAGPPATTKEGKFVFAKLATGKIAVSFTKPGFVADTQSVEVIPGATASATATLKPDKETQAAEAKEWLTKVWKVLGSGDRGEPQQQISASGSASLFDGNGTETHWGITVKLTDRGNSLIDLQTPAGKPAFKLQCDPCHILKASGQSFGKGKSLIDQEEVSILITSFRRVHLGSMVARLTAPEIRVISTELQPSGDRIFLLEGNDESYEVVVGPGLLIARVSAKAKYNGDAYEVVYSDYEKLSDTAQYPRRTEYHMQTRKRGVKVEFSGKVSRLG